MKLSDKKGVQDILKTLAALGLKEVVLCPGSRNVPFIISFNQHPAFHCSSIRDERSAAFYALGKAIELNEPVAVVSTSGSAAINFGPAISEAYYQRIPLIVITADRPREWTDQGDGQTIRQTHLFANYIRKDYELHGEVNHPDESWSNIRSVCEGWQIATEIDRGPVHFNVPLREPLYQTAEVDANLPRISKATVPEKVIAADELDKFRKYFSDCKKVMILAGQHKNHNSLQEALSLFAEFSNTVVLTESTTNVHNRYFIENIDRVITTLPEEEQAAFAPDLLITTSGAIVSKRIKAFLRKHKAAAHWNIDPYDAAMDTYQSLTGAVYADPFTFLRSLAEGVSVVESDYRSKWLERAVKIEELHHGFCETMPYSDFYAFREIYNQLPEGLHLHIANSSPVRYAQLLNNEKWASTWSNRGTSGIDGCTSTAIGAASASPEKQFLLITGDIAFQYDNNGLWNNEQIENLKIIVINNGGGGIFRIIAGKGAEDELSPYLEAAQDNSVEQLAGFYKWNYLSGRDEASLKTALEEFFRPYCRRTILEIFTPRERNAGVLADYWKYLKEKY
ncbi:MAG: 2-succinyl-5-enolpyruvyl-6-hydroxy-3-cyclohexene-1-carboxylic-acid synthase [Chitinophagaceae bacterium]|nr:2-succinyl-5-enolpyruvyl-6-hydroxy-3-cyclohexene-1-carboxylic-acid synthase [Chitinophagaceae bacterium]